MVDTGSFLTVDDVARVLAISRPTVYRRIASGQLSAVRVGPNGDLRIRPEAVERLLRPAIAEPEERGS